MSGLGLDGYIRNTYIDSLHIELSLAVENQTR